MTDTLAIAHKLRDAGFSESQAETVASVFAENDGAESRLAALEARQQEAATKGDLRELIAEQRFQRWAMAFIGALMVANIGLTIRLYIMLAEVIAKLP